MVRASGLVGLLWVLALITGCGNEGAHRMAQSTQHGRTSQEAAVELPLGDTYAYPPPAPAAAPGDVESSEAGVVVGGIDAETHPGEGVGPGKGGDKFSHIEENSFFAVQDSPLSTFSIDVDTASYSKTRLFLLGHRHLPPKDAVRIEELINYFDYEYEGPQDEHPVAIHLETAACPWQPKHRLVRCALQGKRLNGDRPVSNLVFLIDVSGSMNASNKLPLVQHSLGMLVRQMVENDKVSIVVYAGAAGLVLPPTSGTEQAKIAAAIKNLRAGGSTNGGAGIQLAYQLARENFITDGANRVILCTDGDFNVGVSSPGDLVRMAKEKADLGIYLTILGFGIGNHNDALLEELSNKANGNYAFIDTEAEAKKVFVDQLEGTLVTIAKDVKIQVEFNPAEVAAYRLIGYENRQLAHRDFNDDKKDAGDIGAGHRVTALYEIIPVGVDSEFAVPGVDPLKYQSGGETSKPQTEQTDAIHHGELLTLKLRYQPPAGGKSTLLTFPLKDSGQRFTAASPEFQFAAAVASFGMLLRDSKYKGNATYAAVLETATAAKGKDPHGLRQEFLRMVEAAQALSPVDEKPAGTGAWVPANHPQVGQRIPRPSARLAQHPAPPHRISSGRMYFFMGIGFGLVGAVVALLFIPGVIYLRAIFLMNPLPPPEDIKITA
jgi:Ca-activated chloride channel family protein